MRAVSVAEFFIGAATGSCATVLVYRWRVWRARRRSTGLCAPVESEYEMRVGYPASPETLSAEDIRAAVRRAPKRPPGAWH